MRKARALRDNKPIGPIHCLFVYVHIVGKLYYSAIIEGIYTSPKVRGHSTVIYHSFHYWEYISQPICTCTTGKPDCNIQQWTDNTDLSQTSLLLPNPLTLTSKQQQRQGKGSYFNIYQRRIVDCNPMIMTLFVLP